MNKCIKITFEFQDFTKVMVGEEATKFFDKCKELYPEDPPCSKKEKITLEPETVEEIKAHARSVWNGI